MKPRQIQAARRSALVGLEQAYAVRHPTHAGASTLWRLASSKLRIDWDAGTLRSSSLPMHAITPEGRTLLKTWEGCRLSAYPDPASGGAPWTIGYGHTGPDVVPGLTITQQQAEAFLQMDSAVAASAVERLLPGVSLLSRQRDALISFSFNVGVGALEASTLRKRLLAGE